METSHVTLLRSEYDEWKTQTANLEAKINRLEAEKQPKMYIEVEISNREGWFGRKDNGYKWHTILLLPTTELNDIRDEIKVSIENTVQDFLEKQWEVKALRKLPKWFINLLK